MKLTPHGTPLALLASTLLLGLSLPSPGQLTAYSEVAGFDTVTINPANSAGSKLTFAATEFVQTAKYLGLANGFADNRLSLATAAWTDDQFNAAAGSHYIEIISVGGSKTAPQVGSTRSIVDTLPDSLILDTALPAGLSDPVEFRVMSHWTLASIFGATNSAGLKAGSVRSADQVQLWNGSGYDSYYFQTQGLGGTGWRKVGDQSTDAGSTVIRPDQSLVIKRADNSPLALLVSGWVKRGPATFSVVSGFNFLPNPFASPVTLASSGLYRGDANSGVAGGTLSTADQVMLWNGTGYDSFVYQTSGAGGTGWRRLGAPSVDAGSTPIRPGTAVIIRRKRPNGFTWTIPQP